MIFSRVCGWDLAKFWMRSSRVFGASDSQCLSRNCLEVRSQHPPTQWNLRGRQMKQCSVLNNVLYHKPKKIPLEKYYSQYQCCGSCSKIKLFTTLWYLWPQKNGRTKSFFPPPLLVLLLDRWSGIRDPGSGIRDGLKSGYGIRDKQPGSANCPLLWIRNDLFWIQPYNSNPPGNIRCPVRD